MICRIPDGETEKRLPRSRKAAASQIIHFGFREVAARNIHRELSEVFTWDGNSFKSLLVSLQRAGLVPAAAIVPALYVYIKVVAAKLFVVELLWMTQAVDEDGSGPKAFANDGFAVHYHTTKLRPQFIV